MKSTKPPSLLELPVVFEENKSHVAPLATIDSLPLPLPTHQIMIPLPEREQPPRVVIADDETSVIDGLRCSLAGHYTNSLDVRFWQAGDVPSLKDQIIAWMDSGWHPDVVVIDINMDDGGKHGVHYLEELRSTARCAAIAVVLATGNQYRDLDAGKLSTGENLTQQNPDEWLKYARAYEPDSILYGKTADAHFLGRIGEHLPEWKRSARGRAWIKLLGEIAKELDGATLKVKSVADKVVKYAKSELGVDDALVRWRKNNGNYELKAMETTRDVPIIQKGSNISPKDVPILDQILVEKRQLVLRDALTEEEAGVFRKEVTGHRFLGTGMLLGDKTVGSITLLRDPKNSPFEKALDDHYLGVLARLLASALGRDTLMRERQIQLLDFANSVAQTSNVREVCKKLSEMLHRELHGSNHRKSKTTVRLLDFGKGVLVRRAQLGLEAKTDDIVITDKESIYAQCVRKNRLKRVGDLSKECHKKTANDPVFSELCVPLSIGTHATGAVNLEHISTDFYRVNDESFVLAAAGLAASAIERIRTADVLDGMAELTCQFANEETKLLNKRLRELLYEFCGYSVLVELTPTKELSWKVGHVDCRFKGADEELVRKEVELHLSKKLDNSWINAKYQEEKRERKWAYFTEDKSEFVSVALVQNGDGPVTQQADSVLWLRRGEALPHRAIFLMWYLPPPMNESGVELLGTLAQLFSELDERQNRISELIEKNLIGEQAAQIGHVMQHFRHRLGNLTGSLETHIDRLEDAYLESDDTKFESVLVNMRDSVRAIANSFNRSRGYVKKPCRENYALKYIVDKTASSKELVERLKSVSFVSQIADELIVYVDSDIASLCIFSLLENSLDAINGKDQPKIEITADVLSNSVVLTVKDNGNGVSESIRPNLFDWGYTTKLDGLGSALAFAKTRMQVLDGDLLYSSNQPIPGAAFELHFPKSQ